MFVAVVSRLVVENKISMAGLTRMIRGRHSP